ncbi:hypothetical protein GBA52_016582 [Prunus armeniaca]|nr:hypothetical protein GBA52_016582 [Prunus armeniaca]
MKSGVSFLPTFEQAEAYKNGCQNASIDLAKHRSQCSSQNFELKQLRIKARDMELQILKLQAAWELQKQLSSAQPGLEEAETTVLKGSKLKFDN